MIKDIELPYHENGNIRLPLDNRMPPMASVWAMDMRNLMSDQVDIPGKACIAYVDHWGDNTENTVEVEDATCMDLWKAAEELINESGDAHHIYIENFRWSEDDETWYLHTGS